MDIALMDESTLLTDLAESIKDIETCRHALYVGVKEYSGGSVEERLRINQAITETIKAELARRWIKNDVSVQ